MASSFWEAASPRGVKALESKWTLLTRSWIGLGPEKKLQARSLSVKHWMTGMFSSMPALFAICRTFESQPEFERMPYRLESRIGSVPWTG
jgi:hypothetical protein